MEKTDETAEKTIFCIVFYACIIFIIILFRISISYSNFLLDTLSVIAIKKYKKEIKDKICIICREKDEEVKIYYHLNEYGKHSNCFLTYHEECFNRQLEYQKQNRTGKEIECSCKISNLTHRAP